PRQRGPASLPRGLSPEPAAVTGRTSLILGAGAQRAFDDARGRLPSGAIRPRADGAKPRATECALMNASRLARWGIVIVAVFLLPALAGCRPKTPATPLEP